MLEYLSERGRKWVRTLPPLVKAHFDNFYNMYDKEKNPNGLVNMGTAESHLVNNEICDLLRKSAERMDLTGYNIHYNKFEGSDEFRTAIAEHWQNIIFGEDADVTLTKDNVAICAGLHGGAGDAGYAFGGAGRCFPDSCSVLFQFC